MPPGQTIEADQLNRALFNAQRGDHAQAETAFREILLSNPASVDAKFWLATTLAIKGQFTEAIALLHKVIQSRPDHLVALLNLGNASLQLGNFHEAEQAYRTALQLRPDSEPALFGLGYVLQHNGRLAEAEGCLHSALQLQPNNPILWMNLGTVLKQQRKLPAATEAYRKATQLNSDLHQGWCALGQTLLELHRPHEAAQAFRHALMINPKMAEAYIGLGDALCSQQRDDAALELYLCALDLDPESQNAHTKTESLLLRLAGASGNGLMFKSLLENRIYIRPLNSVPDALALLRAYTYPESWVVDETRALLQDFDPEQLYPDAWWKERLSRFGDPAKGHDKIFRGVSSAIYSWSLPSHEAIAAIATFTGKTTLRSFGAGTGYWEWLLERHFGTRVLCGDRVLRRRFVVMAEEDYTTASIGDDEVVFLAWIPLGLDMVMNLLRQMQADQKLIIVGQGPDASGKARICATDEIFRYIESAFEPAGNVQLGYYSYISDDVRLYKKR